MNKHLFTVIAAAILATSMPVSLFSYKTKSKVHYKQYVRPHIKALKSILDEVGGLNAKEKESIVRYIGDYAHNSQRMPRLDDDSKERMLAKQIVDSYETILAEPGNHKRAAKTYLGGAIATVVLYRPNIVKVHASRSAEAPRPVRKQASASTMHTSRSPSRTSHPAVRTRKGTTGLAGQLPKSSRATEASRASSTAKASSASKAAKSSSVKNASNVKPLHKKRAKRKAIKREKRAKREADERRAKREAEQKRKDLEARKIALRAELRRLG